MNIEKTIAIEDFLLTNYTELSLKQKIELLDIRNNESVRRWMLNNSKISLNDHLSFIDDLDNDPSKFYYAVIQNESIMGSVYIVNWNSDNRTCEWGCFLNPEFFGFGLKLGYLFINLMFNYFFALKIYSTIINSNREAIQLNKALGFEKLSVSDNKMNYELKSNFWRLVPKTYDLFVKIIIENYKSDNNAKIS